MKVQRYALKAKKGEKNYEVQKKFFVFSFMLVIFTIFAACGGAEPQVERGATQGDTSAQTTGDNENNGTADTPVASPDRVFVLDHSV